MSRGRQRSLWSISSYICLTLFLTVFLFLGLLNQSTYIGFKRKNQYSTSTRLLRCTNVAQRTPCTQIDFPNFERLATFTKVLSKNDLDLGACYSFFLSCPSELILDADNSRSRAIVIGDVHGMNNSLQ